MNIIQSLVNEGEKQAYQKNWKEFFYDSTKVRGVKAVIDPLAAAGILKAGLDWDGEGWNTAFASRQAAKGPQVYVPAPAGPTFRYTVSVNARACHISQVPD